jgi:hypothetical protein
MAYVKALHYFMNYLRLSYDQYDRLLEKGPKLIQMDLCDFVFLRKKGTAYAPVSVYIALLLTSFIQ